jgi:hypothetical protein
MTEYELNTATRAQLICYLEANGRACHDNESDQSLLQAALETCEIDDFCGRYDHSFGDDE